MCSGIRQVDHASSWDILLGITSLGGNIATYPTLRLWSILYSVHLIIHRKLHYHVGGTVCEATAKTP